MPQSVFQTIVFEKRSRLEEIVKEVGPCGTLVFGEDELAVGFVTNWLKEAGYEAFSLQRQDALANFKEGMVIITTDENVRDLGKYLLK